jgi:hypothetical protein
VYTLLTNPPAADPSRVPRLHRSRFRRCLFAALLALGAAVPARLWGHEIPARVTVLVLVRPDATARTLRLLVRVPLEAMRDLSFPLRGPGYLDLPRTEPFLLDAARLWIAGSIELYENGAALPDERIGAARVSLPADRSFASWEGALAHVTGPPLPPETELVWQQALLDVLLEVPVSSVGSDFSIAPRLAHLGIRTTTVVRFQSPGGAERAFQFSGDPGLVRLDPRWHQAALKFVRLGFLHIMDGLDHLLFLLCLVVPFRRVRPLVAIVTSFTVAHSITLAASAMGLVPRALWFPSLIETLIALSIVWMAFENILGPRLERRWVMAFGFGLVHGFGFSFFLRDSLQFAGGHLATSLAGFNIGVELGQLLVVAAAVPALSWLFRRVPEKAAIILLSAVVAHSAWHWMLDRGSRLLQYRFQWPSFDAALLASLIRGLMLALLLAGVVWLMSGAVRRLMRPERRGETAVGTAG